MAARAALDARRAARVGPLDRQPARLTRKGSKTAPKTRRGPPRGGHRRSPGRAARRSCSAATSTCPDPGELTGLRHVAGHWRRPRLRQRAGGRRQGRGARPRHALRPQAGRGGAQPFRSPKPRSISSARWPAVPGLREHAELHRRRRGRRRTPARAAAGPRAAARRRRACSDRKRPVAPMLPSGSRWVPSSLHGAHAYLAAGQARARRVHPRVGERRPQPLGVGGQRAGAVQRLGRERVLVLEAVRAQGLEPLGFPPGPRPLPLVEELVHLHPREG